MFGIGLPEMILILALALIVVGPDKLPDLARSVAKGVLELKKTAEGLKDSFSEDGNPFDEIKPELEETAKSLKNDLLESTTYSWKDGIPPKNRQDLQTDVTEEIYNDESELLTSADNQAPLSDQENMDTMEEQQKEDPTSSKIHNTVRDDLAAGPKP